MIKCSCFRTFFLTGFIVFSQLCNKEPASHLLAVTDKDGPGFTAPYSVSLQGLSKSNWTARMNASSMYTFKSQLNGCFPHDQTQMASPRKSL